MGDVTSSNGKLAVVFSPQGSQAPGMGKDLYDNLAMCKNVFDTANDVLGFDLASLCFNGPDEELRSTEVAQPALLTTSIAAFRALQSKGFSPAVVAGHSVGEYAALVASGAIGFEDGVRLVRRRGELMRDAGTSGEGTMAAIIGLPSESVQQLVAEAAQGCVLGVANYNSPEQTVISGEKAAIERACELAKAKGAKRALPLNVSGAFHSQLMKPAAAAMADELSAVSFQTPEIPIVANFTADFVRTPEEIKQSLVNQLAGSVLWVDSVRKIIADGCSVFVEAGAGQALVGMIRRIDGTVKAAAVSDCASLQAFVEDPTPALP